MIVKNHTILLKDTSETEMIRFRQIMLGIWRQQIEDDENSDKMLKDTNALKEGGTTVSSLIFILLWIKKNIGNKNKELKLSSLPKNTFKDSLSDTFKGHFVKCNRYLFETVVDLKNIKFEVSFRPVQTVFLLSICNPKKNLVFQFETSAYESLEYLAKFIGYDIETFKKTIIQQYKREIKTVGNNKNRLDIIYEVIPEFILRALKTDEQMYSDLWTLLDQDISDTLGRNEDKAILNILKTLQKKNAKKLFEKLYERPLWVMKLYKTFTGDDRKNYVALIMDLCRYNKKEPKKEQTIYLKDGYWLNNVQLNANWSNYMIAIENSSTLLTNLGNLLVSSSTVTRSKIPTGFKTLYKGGELNPMDLISVKSVLGMDKDQKIITEAASTQVALFIKYKVDELSEEVFWDVINVASTLAGGYGAFRVLTLKSTGWLLKTAAILQLSKTTADLVMLNDNAKKALKQAGLGILVDNWTTISITADLTFLTLDGLFALAKYGSKGAKMLREANQLDEAAHLEKQTKKAFIEIEKQTGKDVSKMSNAEFDQFVKKEQKKAIPEQYAEFIDTPENIPGQKVPERDIHERRESRKQEINKETEEGLWKDKDHNFKTTFSADQLESFIEIELIHKTKVRPSRNGEAGDVVGLTGKWEGKTFDAAGLPNFPGAIKGWEHKFTTNLNRFKRSIDEHFNKLNKTPPLDKFVLDLRHVDKYPPQTKREIMNYLQENYQSYLNDKNKFEIIF